MRVWNVITAAGLVLAAVGPVAANDFAAELNALAAGKIKEIVQSAELIEAIKAQNTVTEGYDQAKIDELDKIWRAEVDAADQPLIDATLDNATSAFLASYRESSDGLFTEIFAMDNKGLNVGQSDVTSDYWQGDEAKWQETFLIGPDAVHLSDVELDESTQTLQSQISVSVVDPDSGAPIGAVTFGVNVELLD
ncbi:MAG TPA: hypothetical protein VMP03_01820 [Methylomirabilota bacterium]|nr:hypothetical protein [Methylomirabilota bacterium]